MPARFAASAIDSVSGSILLALSSVRVYPWRFIFIWQSSNGVSEIAIVAVRIGEKHGGLFTFPEAWEEETQTT